MHSSDEKSGGLSPYLSTLGAVSLAFGCAVGWGAFVVPGTTFLPVAGPLGTLIGLGIGAAVMFLVGRNYHYLIQKFPEAGGAYGYVKKVCGGDHGFICGWFLILTYVAIAWPTPPRLRLSLRRCIRRASPTGATTWRRVACSTALRRRLCSTPAPRSLADPGLPFSAPPLSPRL